MAFRLRASLLLTVALLCVGCTVPVAVDLDESAANRIVEALGREGVAADKVVDPRGDGRWRIEVAEDDASAAVAVMARENLPPPVSAGLLERLDDGALVPSRAAERARVLAATAAELERSLGALDSVVSVRVHLAVPADDPLRPAAETPAASASVLLSYRGDRAPLDEPHIQRLVAGAVAGLQKDRVVVVATPAPEPAPRADRELTRFGPITTTKASIGRLRAAAIGLSLLGLVLAGVIAALWAELRRQRRRSGPTEAAEGPR